MQPTTSLLALNFALAARGRGFGPFLGVYPAAAGLRPRCDRPRHGALPALLGLLATTPIGRSSTAPALSAVCSLARSGHSRLGPSPLVATKSLWLIALSQLVIGIADSSIAPLVAALTLGLVARPPTAGRSLATRRSTTPATPPMQR